MFDDLDTLSGALIEHVSPYRLLESVFLAKCPEYVHCVLSEVLLLERGNRLGMTVVCDVSTH
ncbi:hypothetical protein CO712_35630 (plasmid) [Burkholderia gladioli pv. gladioli]|nr:hypothetical protein CO712_35630 [Burkholderia gladioli pv. gladioli]